MIDDERVLAIVPARGGSKGLLGKNGRPLLGKPLLAWPVSAARSARCIDRIIVSTDDDSLAAIARAAGAEVPFMRPPALAGDCASSAEVVIHALDFLVESGDSFGYVVLLEPTSPLTEGCDIDAALSRLHGARDRADSIVGVVRSETEHPAFAVSMSSDGTICPLAGGRFESLPRRQDLSPAYRLEGSLYASEVNAFRRNGSFCHQRTMGFPVPRYKSFEVDDLLDFVCIEAVASRLDELRPGPGPRNGEKP